MRILSNAKINLGLYVGPKREDGFHSIESLFIPIDWYDEILIKQAKQFRFTKSGIPIDGNENQNLCVKAYELMRRKFAIAPVSMELKKEVPIGAGLGGGSSNAANVLSGLNDLFGLRLSNNELMQLAGELGSDCPYFISNKPALVSGRGEVINTDIAFNMETYCLVVYPDIHIETRLAYEKVTPRKKLGLIVDQISKPLEQWQTCLINDFEESILTHYPALIVLREKLKQMGAEYISMSGSGSSFFAFFKEKPTTIRFDQKYSYRIFKLAF